MSSSGPDVPSFDGPSPGSSCATLVINTALSSPQPNVITTLNRGDLLTITIASDQGPIQAITANGELAGTILSRGQVTLLGCIKSGTKYVAEVISINGGECNIQIRPI